MGMFKICRDRQLCDGFSEAHAPLRVKLFRYLFLQAGVVLAGVLLLVLAAFFPQRLVDQNIISSAAVFEEEGTYPVIGGRGRSSQLDNYSDALILQGSASLNASEIGTILTNPYYYTTGPAVDFPAFASEKDTLPVTGHYIRYWQGFRVVVRFLLMFIPYAQIRHVIAFAFLMLFSASLILVSQKLDLRAGLFYALSVIIMSPQVICNSLQYSACFLMAFLFMLFIPAFIKKGLLYEYFMFCGMTTMYFDFYTSPLLTLGYPLVFAVLLCTREKPLWKEACKASLAWLVGYGFMWIAKLALVTVFTDLNGFQDGFSSFSARVGLVRPDHVKEYYNLFTMIRKLVSVICENRLVTVFWGVALLFLTGKMTVSVIRHSDQRKALLSYAPLWLPVAVMVIWYMIAVQPTTIHFYFQYRNIGMAIWAVFMYVTLPPWPVHAPNTKVRSV